MKRKLVRQGAATLMVSLPSKWAKKNHLKKGAEINLEEIDNNLVLSRDSITSKKQTKINITNQTESSIRTVLVNAYRAGYDKITIQFDEEKKYQIILNTIDTYLIGFEVIKKEKNHCIIENITEPSEDQFDILLKKIFYNTNRLIQDTEERLKNKTKFQDYKEVVLKIHQYDNFCRRVISKRNLYGSNSNLFWAFLTLFIHGQREIYHLNKFLEKNKINYKDFTIYNKLKQIYNLLQEGYLNKDISKLEKIHEIEKIAIYKDYYNLAQKGKEQNIINHHLAVSIKNFYLASSPLLGMLLASNNSG